MARLPATAALQLLLLALCGCSVIHTGGFDNETAPRGRDFTQRRTDEVRSASYLASLKVDWRLDWRCRNGLEVALGDVKTDPLEQCKGQDDRFLGIALSGGGSRAAIFSAAALFELRKYGILQQADVLSSVSGGSYTAALYALSCDDPKQCPPTVEGPARTVWSESEVYGKLQRNFVGRWFGNWFWPDNVARYWLTDFNRSQIMAQTLNANLFDNSTLGFEAYRFQDLNPQRPHLIINATDFSDHKQKPADLSPLLKGLNETCRRARFFTFTRETFAELKSDLDQYRIANAVVASSAFPGVFNYVTLKNYALDQYIHLMDAGPFDNLGLPALLCSINNAEKVPEKEKRVIVMIDASVSPRGKSSSEAATRSGLDHFVDMNALDAIDILFEAQRRNSIDDARDEVAELIPITFGDLTTEAIEDKNPEELYRIVNSISTNLKIEDWQADCLKRAAYFLVKAAAARILREDRPALRGLVGTPSKEDAEKTPPLCKEPPPKSVNDVVGPAPPR